MSHLGNSHSPPEEKFVQQRFLQSECQWFRPARSTVRSQAAFAALIVCGRRFCRQTLRRMFDSSRQAGDIGRVRRGMWTRNAGCDQKGPGVLNTALNTRQRSTGQIRNGVDDPREQQQPQSRSQKRLPLPTRFAAWFFHSDRRAAFPVHRTGGRSCSLCHFSCCIRQRSSRSLCGVREMISRAPECFREQLLRYAC